MKLIKKYFLKILLSLIFIGFGILVGVKYYFNINNNKEVKIDSEVVEIEPVVEKEEEVVKVFVDVKGAVNNPGVYEIENNKKVIDVVNLAGGFTDDADTSFVNLAKMVTDEMVVKIYTKNEIKAAKKQDTLSTVVDNTCVCPKITNDACLNNGNSSNKSNSTNSDVTQTKININTATLEQLQTLSGIGESKAKAIIDYRTENGNFTKIEDLLNVSGIGESVYEKIKDYITV